MAEPRSQRGRVIRASEQQASAWQPPDVNGQTPQEAEHGGPLLTAAQLDELSEKAQSEGYEAGRQQGFEYGHKEGMEAGRAEVQQRIARLDGLLEALDTPFEQLDDQVEQEVVTLVIAMVRQLVRREIKADPAQIIGVVREALGVLPVNARRIRVLLHPDDAGLVREAYTLGDSDQKWQIIEDPVVARGGCRVYTENSQIDATLESRLNSLIAPLLADERGDDG